MIQVYAGLGMVALALSGVAVSNILYDRGVPGTVSRRAAPALGGAAVLVAVLWLEPWTAVSIAAALALLVLVLRISRRRTLRGVGRSTESRDWAEVAYPVAATVSLAIGWGLLGDRWLAFAPIAFLSWGDSVAGLVRGASRWTGRDMGPWRPSIAMLGVCLVAAMLFQPYWIGAAGAVAATGAERFRLVAHRVWSGNWVPDDPVIVAASLGLMGALVRIGV